MSELQDAGRMLEVAEQAALADDLAQADQLLRDAARIQEAELGPLHPDLANTINNLAIVAEKTGRLGDAETFYRRAVAIASASLPVDHPMIAASRKNLEDFSRAHGLPIDTPATPPLSGSSWPVSRPPTPAASEPVPPTARRIPSALALVAIGVVVLVTATFFMRPSRDASTTVTTAEPTPADERAPRAQPPAPIGQARPPTDVPRQDRDVPTDKPAAPTSSSGAPTLATAQLCRTFSTSGASWQCDPAVDPVSPGLIVLYTRVTSPRDTVVVHRWYRGDALRQSVTLTIRANATAGYRTYSRQTVDGGADWRVEVSAANGDVLHERRFAVR
jgi:hypothetical protein